MPATSQTRINQEVAVALERLSGRMDTADQRLKDLEDQRREEDARRNSQIAKQPDTVRSILSAYGGCVGQFVYAAIASLELIVAVAAIVISITRR